MNFKNWLATESVKISDYLKNIDVKSYKDVIRPFLQTHLQKQDLETAINLLTYVYIEEGLPKERISSQLVKDWGQWGDYLSTMIPRQRSKFTLGMNRRDLNNGSTEYHRDLGVVINLRKGPKGHSIVDISTILEKLQNSEISSKLSNIYQPQIWQGWNWTSLGCGKSSEEAAAGGHCGNTGAKGGDNIVSLRDSKGNVHLTFIVNNGILGEAKGLNNLKPTENYYPAIVALLLSGYIKKYKGGGYEVPEKGILNFNINDLDEDLQNYINGHFAKTVQHKTPENYYPVQWIDQWTQEKVNTLNIEQKIELANQILKIFDNHKPFVSREYNNEEEEYKLKNSIAVPTINFDFNKLIQEIIPHVKNIKQVTEMLGRMHDVYSDNVVGTDEEHKLFRPDTQPPSITAGTDTTGKSISYKDWLKHNLKKIPTFNIDEKTINQLAYKLIEKTKHSSIRERSELINALENIGYRDNSNSPDAAYAADKWKEWNVFDKEIKEISQEIFDEVINKNSIPDTATSAIINLLQSVSMSPYQWPEFTKDRKKIMFHFSFNFEYDAENFKSKLEKIYQKLRPQLLKKGFSSYLATSYHGIALHNHKKHNDLFQGTVSSFFEKAIKEKIKQKIKLNYKGKVKINSDSHYDEIYFIDAMKALKEFKNTGKIVELEVFKKSLEEFQNKAYSDTLNELESIVLNNMDAIIHKINYPKEWNYDKKQNVVKARSIVRHHECLTFKEWISTKQ